MKDVTTMDGRRLFRFADDAGTVWVIVTPVGPSSVKVDVTEESVAVSARGESGGLSERTTALIEQARNRFGTRAILGMIRYVVAAIPGVKSLIVDRVTGANTGTVRVLRV